MTASVPAFTETSTSRFADIHEGELKLRLHYNDVGEGHETVVMLHGSGPGASGWANFHRNIEPLVNAGYRVILMDCPGWSKSDSIVSTGSRSELNARCLKAVLDGLGIDRVQVIGNSMGAHSAVAFALANPTRTDKLVLMGGGTGGPSQFVPMPTEGIKLIGALYREPTVENIKRMMNVFVFDDAEMILAMLGLMQDQPLLVSSILCHAARHHPTGEIVSKTVEGPLHRTTYREVEPRCRRVARVLQRHRPFTRNTRGQPSLWPQNKSRKVRIIR